jgi:Domain of unknown function (DUF5666)
MQKVSRWFTLVSAVAVGIVAAGCGSESVSGPTEVVSGATTEELGTASIKTVTPSPSPSPQAGSGLELVGYVKSVTRTGLTLSGKTVVVTSATEIKRNKTRVALGSIKVGERVKVEGTLRSDGKLQAREVKVGYKGSTPNTDPNDRSGDDRGGHGSDDPPNHDSGDDHGGNGNDDGPNHDAGDDHGGNDDGSGHHGGGHS